MTTNFKQRTPDGTDVDIDQIFITNTELNSLRNNLPAHVLRGTTLWLWGSDMYGSLGQGTYGVVKSSPIQVGSLTNWTMIDSNGWHTIALKQDGTAWGWGNNDVGQLGIALGDSTPRSSPVQIGSNTNWVKIVVGDLSEGITGLIDSDGSLWTCGSNAQGILGTSDDPATTTVRLSPVQVTTLMGVTDVSFANACAAAIAEGGKLFTWGDGYAGAGGRSGTGDVSRPTQVGSLTDWKQVTVSIYSGMAVKTDGTLWAWGDAGSTGKLGKGNLTDYSSPVQVGVLTNWKKVAMSKGGTDFHSGAIKTDGTLWMWGGNSSGQLGRGTITPVSSPVQVGSLTNWADIFLIWGTTLALKTDGTAWIWGDCLDGPFGTTAALYSSPVQIGSLTTWTAITHNGLLKLT